MTSRLKLLALPFLICTVVSACNQKPDSVIPENVLAVVNDVEITEDDLHTRIHSGKNSRGERDRFLKDIITEELLYQKGLKLGLDKDPKYRNSVRIMEQRLKDFKRSEMARLMRNAEIAPAVNVRFEETKTYYAENKASITTSLHLNVFQFPDEEQAGQALRRINAGESIEAVAAELYADLPKGKTPWDRGFLRWHEIPIEFEDAIHRLKPGEVSSVLNSRQTGVCIVKLVERRSNPDASFDNISASIMNRLRDIRLLEAHERYIDDLKKEAKIVNFEERRKGP